MSNCALAVFSYAFIALFSALILCNVLSVSKTGFEKKRISPLFAFFLGLTWPIGLLAAYVAFIRDK